MDSKKVAVVLLVIAILFSLGTIYYGVTAGGSVGSGVRGINTIIQQNNAGPSLGSVGFNLIEPGDGA